MLPLDAWVDAGLYVYGVVLVYVQASACRARIPGVLNYEAEWRQTLPLDSSTGRNKTPFFEIRTGPGTGQLQELK